MSDFATSIGILSTQYFYFVFEVLGWSALIGISIGWLKRHVS